jgi:hypothetical protein
MLTFNCSTRAALLLSCLALGATVAPATAQFSVMDPAAQNVMSSRDFNALLETLGFDAGQRATVGPLFDDAQSELIAARNDLAAIAAPGPKDDSKSFADYESRKRRAYERMKSAEHDFFAGLAAIATPAQQPAVERERLAASRRLIRRTLGSSQSSQGPVRVDFVTSVTESQLSEAEKAACLTALSGYQVQLTALLEQALNQGLEVSTRAAKIREDGSAPAPPAADVEVMGEGGLLINDPARLKAAAPFEATLDKIALLHQQAMNTIESTAGAMSADSINSTAARRIWPRAGMDMRSPRATFAQLRAEVAAGKRPAELTAALDAVQPAWLASWWSATKQACDAENFLRRFGIFGSMGQDAKAARDALKSARETRDACNRTAWKAIAAADSANSKFYEQYIAPPTTDRDRMIMAGHGDPTPPKLEAGEGNAMTFSTAGSRTGTAIMMVSRSSDGENEDVLEVPMVFEASGGPMSIMMGPDGVATFLSDTVGDGMADESMGMFVTEGGAFTSQLSGAVMPSPMNRGQVAELAQTLSPAPAPTTTLDQLYTDYSEKMHALNETAGAAAISLLSGPAAGGGIRLRHDGSQEEAPKPRTIQDLKAGVGKLDAFVAQMADIDDALVSNLAAACAPTATPSQIQVLAEERARQRLRQLRYPTSPMLMHSLQDSQKHLDLASIVRQANLSPTDRKTADGIVAEWSPTAVGALEQVRSTFRSVSLELLAEERKMFERMEKIREGANGSTERQIMVESSASEDEGDFRLHSELIEKARNARKAPNVLAREARDRLNASLSTEGRAALQAAWCRAVAPQAFADKRNADARLVQALGLPDATPEQRGQIDALRAAHSAEHARITEQIGVLAAEIAIPVPETTEEILGPGGVARRGGRSPHQAQLDMLRFDRSELNERTLRRLRTILTATQNQAVPALGAPSANPPEVGLGIQE